MKTAAVVLAGMGLAAGAGAAVRERVVAYPVAGVEHVGMLAWDDALDGPRPGVLVVHEWYGLNAYARRRARDLAALGYAAFAADLYGGGKVAATAAEAGALSSAMKGDRPRMRRAARAALSAMEAQPETRAGNTAAIGYCFGGTAVLELARSGAGVKGVVSFHGGLDAGAGVPAGPVRAAVLVLHGGDDPHAPDAQLVAFIEEMRAAKADWQVVAYGGAVHAFTSPAAGNDPARGAAYDARADRRSWAAMRAFLDEVLGPPAEPGAPPAAAPDA